MSGTIRVRVKREGDLAEVKSLITHPMETGAREDPETGVRVPRHHITRVTFSINGNAVLIANCGTAVARNPFFTFKFMGAGPGDSFVVNWVDNLGESDTLETILD